MSLSMLKVDLYILPKRESIHTSTITGILLILQCRCKPHIWLEEWLMSQSNYPIYFSRPLILSHFGKIKSWLATQGTSCLASICSLLTVSKRNTLLFYSTSAGMVTPKETRIRNLTAFFFHYVYIPSQYFIST